MEIEGIDPSETPEWSIDGELKQRGGLTYLWPLEEGHHTLSVGLFSKRLPTIGFQVKRPRGAPMAGEKREGPRERLTEGEESVPHEDASQGPPQTTESQ